MTATITALPHAETTAADELEDLLWLSQDREVMHVVSRLACPELRAAPEELALAWEDFRESARVRDGLATGEVTWQEFEPELTCADRQEVAFQLAAEQADSARALIQHGRTGGF